MTFYHRKTFRIEHLEWLKQIHILIIFQNRNCQNSFGNPISSRIFILENDQNICLSKHSFQMFFYIKISFNYNKQLQ